MKKYLLLFPILLMTSCALMSAKVIWYADECEVNLISKCQSFCKTNKSKVEEFVKTTQYYRCICVKDMEATFTNVCD